MSILFHGAHFQRSQTSQRIIEQFSPFQGRFNSTASDLSRRLLKNMVILFEGEAASGGSDRDVDGCRPSLLNLDEKN